MKNLIKYAFCLPSDLVAWLVLIWVDLVWGGESEWKGGVWWVRLRENSWPARTWFKRWGATTFGHAVMVGHRLSTWKDEGLRGHEMVHVEQYEQEAVQGAILFAVFASLGWWWIGLIWWCLGGFIEMATGFFTAWLRGEPAYRGSHLEEAARGHDHE